MEAKTIKDAVYTGAFILVHQEQREGFLEVFSLEENTSQVNKYFDHMTIAFRPTLEEYVTLNYGEIVKLTLVGIASNTKARAFLVESELPVQSEWPHITISTAEGVKPHYSNILFKEANLGHGEAHYRKLDKPIELEARVGWHDGKGAHYHSFLEEEWTERKPSHLRLVKG